MSRRIPFLVSVLAVSALVAVSAPAQDEEAAGPARIVVILPEQVDTEWFWYYYTETSQHLVQAAVEKALMDAGLDVLDVTAIGVFKGDGSIDTLWDQGFALRKAAEAGATHLVIGRATASRMSHDTAYGVSVYRSAADITAKLIRVSDGKVLVVTDSSATEGGQAQKAAGREALKKAGKIIATKLASAAAEELASAEEP
ncbi:MAG: hypothetical protein JXQ75_17930 [Phycisphaerae bacterium]|nr:hypothetical protein [Phycisphaerae bacterium]